MTRHPGPRASWLLATVLAGCGDKAEDNPVDDPYPQEEVDEDGDGYSPGRDCDDTDGSVFPGADELCDGVDNDCDGETDEDDALDASTWYLDEDGDGFGDEQITAVACQQPDDHVADDSDCDDGNAEVHPDAEESCATEGIDDDCDGAIDEDDAVDALSWYADADHDGYGDDSTGTRSCEPPYEWSVEDPGEDGVFDCDDTQPTVHPGAEPSCDDLDNDCDGIVDGGWRVPTDYADIQTAIDAASGGETICVEAGVYTETIDFSGKDIALIGTAGAQATTIDGGGVGPVVSIQDGETEEAELSGFTITGGDAEQGAGVLVSESSPTLIDLVIEGNSCTSESSCWGSGLFVTDAAPTLLQVEIKDNTCTADSECVAAGAAFHESEAQVNGLTATGNHASSGEVSWGAGITVWGGALSGSHLRSVGNLSESNQQGSGAGLTLLHSTGTSLENVIVAGNAASGRVVVGAGLLIQESYSVDLHNAVVHANDSQAGSKSYGAGVTLMYTSSATFHNVTVTQNTESGSGSTYRAAGISAYTSSASLDLSYCNVYGNDIAEFYLIDDQTGTDGNISTDPGFTDVSSSDPLDWDLTLDIGSDLVDAGDPSLFDPDGSTSDIGAYGGEGAADWGRSATIEELRDGTVPMGYLVSLTGVVVTAVDDEGFVIQDPDASAPAYSGIHVDVGEAPPLARGMELELTGALVDEDGLAQLLADWQDIAITGAPGEPEPVELTLAQAQDEAYEGVLVTITDGSLDDAAYDCSADDSSCTDSNLWTLTDGTEALIVYDKSYESDDWSDQVGVSPVTGVMTHRFDRYRLTPRSSWDF